MEITNFSLVYRTTQSYYHHNHSSYEFHYICRGSCFFDRQGCEYKIKNGTFLYFSPGEEHHIIINDSSSPVTHYSFQGILNKGDSDLHDLLENRILDKTVRVGYNKPIFFEEVRSRIESTSQDQRMAGSYQLISFLYQLPSLQSDIDRIQRRNNQIDKKIEFFLLTMQKEIFGTINLSQMIERSGYSQSYLIRRFKAVTGLPPNQYYLRLKIETAKILLAESDESIKSLAERLCFTDEFYFSRIFKKWTGSSPLQWRSQPKDCLIGQY